MHVLCESWLRVGKSKEEDTVPYNTLDMRVIARALSYRNKAAKLRRKAEPLEKSDPVQWSLKHIEANQLDRVADDMWDMLSEQEKDDEKHGYESPTNIDGRMNK